MTGVYIRIGFETRLLHQPPVPHTIIDLSFSPKTSEVLDGILYQNIEKTLTWERPGNSGGRYIESTMEKFPIQKEIIGYDHDQLSHTSKAIFQFFAIDSDGKKHVLESPEGFSDSPSVQHECLQVHETELSGEPWNEGDQRFQKQFHREEWRRPDGETYIITLEDAPKVTRIAIEPPPAPVPAPAVYYHHTPQPSPKYSSNVFENAGQHLRDDCSIQ